MIEQAVQELTPIVGTRPACRALGAAPATIYRRRRPSRAQADAGAAVTGQGAIRAPSARRCSPSSTASGSLTAPPRRSGRRCWTRAVTWLRSGRCTGCSPLNMAGCGSDATSSPTRPTPSRSCSPSARTSCGRWDISKLKGPGEVDVLLPLRDPRRVQPLRRRLDRPAPRGRPARQGADRPGRRAAADRRKGS